VSRGRGRSVQPATRLAHAGRRRDWTGGVVNPPVVRASTCLFATLAEFEAARPDKGLYYARRGTPSQWALEEALTAIEPGAAGTALFPSGVAAITAAILAVAGAGDHVLLPDSAYQCTRDLAAGLLPRLGIEASWYDPLTSPEALSGAVRPNTRLLFLETPGSLTFEVQDLEGLVGLARAHGLVTILDNTWATPLRLRAIAAGVDLSVQSLTKYVAGHSDVMLGAVTASPAAWDRLKRVHDLTGQFASPDDCTLALRGLRTLAVRLDRHETSALRMAAWLAGHPLVDQVLHPALASCPGNRFFARDFTGSTGLFAFTLKRPGKARLAAMLDGLELFGMGFSWGGYESLIIPFRPERALKPFAARGPALRVSAGLEDADDLIADLEAGLARFEAAMG
jgi:cystathionine beta-lyase